MAETLRNAELSVSARDVAPRPEGYVYHWEIEGALAVDAAGTVLGRVTELADAGGRPLLVLETRARRAGRAVRPSDRRLGRRREAAHRPRPAAGPSGLGSRVRFDIVTIFPGYFASPLGESLVGRAVEAGILDVHLVDLRDFSDDPHRKVDDEPYGGGPGMVLTAPPVFAAVEALRSEAGAAAARRLPVAPGPSLRREVRPGARRAAARRARLRPLRGDRRADACRGPVRRGDLSRGLRPFRRRSRGARDPRGRVPLSPGRGPGRRERVGGQLRGRAARPSALQPPALVPRARRA